MTLLEEILGTSKAGSDDTNDTVREPLKSGSTIVGIVTNAEQLLANLRAQLAL